MGLSGQAGLTCGLRGLAKRPAGLRESDNASGSDEEVRRFCRDVGERDGG